MSSKTQGDSQADKNIEIDPAKRKPKMGSQFQHVTLPPTPESIAFAGEVLPIHIDDVRERLEKELIRNSFYHSNTLDYIKRANRFFSIIDPILEKEGIPLDFKYLAVAESGLYNPTSPAGAKACGSLCLPQVKPMA